jgi:hypothetical protein
VVFCLARGDSYILAPEFPGKPPMRTASHFPCSIGLDFSSVCKESDLRVNGSCHGCVDSPFVARWIFVSFQAIFVDFLCAACFFDSEVFGFEFVGVDHGYLPRASLCLILTPPNFEFGFRLKDFGWTLGFWLSSVSIQFPAIQFVGGPKFWGIASPRDASHLPQIFPQELKPFGRSMEV